MLRKLATCLLAGLAVGCGAQEEPGRLVVVERHPRGAIYQEGSIGFLRITRIGAGRPAFAGRVTEPHGARGRTLFDRELPPGEYRVVSFQRPCNGNCGALGGMSDRCEVEVRVRSGETVRRVMALGRRGGCRFGA